jgi:hypothetical protein
LQKTEDKAVGEGKHVVVPAVCRPAGGTPSRVIKLESYRPTEQPPVWKDSAERLVTAHSPRKLKIILRQQRITEFPFCSNY